MKRLDRYVLVTWVLSFAVTAAALLGIVLLVDLVSHLDDFLKIEDEPRLSLVLRYYGVRVPVYFVWIAPMVSLCAMMLTLTRFSRANEILPVLVAGRSVRRFLAPAFAGALGVSGLMMLIDEKINPALAEPFRETERIMRGDREVENVIISDKVGQDWFAESYHPKDYRLSRVHIVRIAENFRRESDIQAEEAVWKRNQKGWLLKNGVKRTYDPETQRRIRSEPIPPEGLLVASDLRASDIEEADDMFRLSTFSQLRKNIANFPLQPFWRVQWHSKLTMPLANLVLLLVGVPLILRSGGKNVFAGVAISLAIGLLFFGIVISFLDAGNTGKLDAVLAAWFPVILFGAAGVAMMDGVST